MENSWFLTFVVVQQIEAFARATRAMERSVMSCAAHGNYRRQRPLGTVSSVSDDLHIHPLDHRIGSAHIISKPHLVLTFALLPLANGVTLVYSYIVTYACEDVNAYLAAYTT